MATNKSVPVILGLGGIAAVIITAGISGKGIGSILSGEAGIGSSVSNYFNTGQVADNTGSGSSPGANTSGSTSPVPTASQVTAGGDSPAPIIKMIAWCNTVAGIYQYTWGGGHQHIGLPNSGACSSDGSGSCFGFDCSGTVSGALGAAGFLDQPLVSGELASWGVPGAGKYVTVYANSIHTFMKILGHWFGTGKLGDGGGPDWGNFDPDLSSYTVRHPQGY